MKKRRFLLVLTLLISVYAVQAQEEVEETILGLSVSSLLVIFPIMMVALGLIFFIGLYLKDHLKDITHFFKTSFTRRRRPAERKKKLVNYPKEVQALQKRIPTIEAEEAIQQLSNLAKKFFAEKFSIDYEFTHGELENELKKEKESWAEFPKKLSHLRYSGEPLAKKEAAALIKEFWDIVKYEKRTKLSLTLMEKLRKRRLGFEIELLKHLNRYLQKAKPKGKEKLTSKDVIRYFVKRQKQNLSNLSNMFKKVETDAIAEIKMPLDTVGKVKGYFLERMTEKRIRETLDLIEEAQKQITKGKIDQAKKAYHQAYQLYYKLPVEEQLPIITELQNIQKRIHEHRTPPKIEKYKKIPGTTKEIVTGQIKDYFQKRLTKQRINKVKDLIEEAQKQITKGKIDQAKEAHKQAHHLYYRLPISHQTVVLSQLKEIKDRITDAEKSIEQLELEELSQDLNKLKSESDVYVVFDKSDVSKKINLITKYAQRLGEQGVYGIKAGKVHLKDQLKELAKSAKKIEQNGKRFTPKEKSFLSKIKDITSFYTKKEAALEEAFKQKRKQLFTKLHGRTKRVVRPSKPPLPPSRITEEEIKGISSIQKLLIYLRKKKIEGLYTLLPEGKEFLNKIESLMKNIRYNERKGITALKHYERELLNSLTPFLRKKEETALHSAEEEKRMLEFLEYMRDNRMIQLQEQRLQKEKERFEEPSLIETPRVKMNITRLKKLQQEEESLMQQIQKMPKSVPMPVPKTERKIMEKYRWEVQADKVKRQRTKELNALAKEEEEILAKLKGLE